jgi:HlyD family secretion protein
MLTLLLLLIISFGFYIYSKIPKTTHLSKIETMIKCITLFSLLNALKRKRVMRFYSHRFYFAQMSRFRNFRINIKSFQGVQQAKQSYTLYYEPSLGISSDILVKNNEVISKDTPIFKYYNPHIEKHILAKKKLLSSIVEVIGGYFI